MWFLMDTTLLSRILCIKMNKEKNAFKNKKEKQWDDYNKTSKKISLYSMNHLNEMYIKIIFLMFSAMK